MSAPDRPIPTGGPWTRHGHPIPGVTVAGGRPPAVARCGGPALCRKCREDVAQAGDGLLVAPDRPTLEQVDADLAVADDWSGPGRQIVARLAAEMRALGAELELFALHPAENLVKRLLEREDECARLRAALVARTPQPVDLDELARAMFRANWPGGDWSTLNAHSRIAWRRASTAWLAENQEDRPAAPGAPPPAVPAGPAAVAVSRLEGLAQEWDWTAGTLDDRGMAAGMYRCATDLRAQISALAGDPWGGHSLPAVPDGEDPDATETRYYIGLTPSGIGRMTVTMGPDHPSDFELPPNEPLPMGAGAPPLYPVSAAIAADWGGDDEDDDKDGADL